MVHIIQERIYEIMRQKRMCQASVARAIGISPKTFNAMLNGRQLIRIEVIPKLCEALGCKPNDLFTDDRRE